MRYYNQAGLYTSIRAIVKNNGTNSRDHQPIKEFRVFLRFMRVLRVLRFLERFEGFEGCYQEFFMVLKMWLLLFYSHVSLCRYSLRLLSIRYIIKVGAQRCVALPASDWRLFTMPTC